MAPIKVAASHASSIYRYKNLKEKVMKCCMNIYFNKQCLIRKVIPNYARVEVPNTSPAAQYTRQKVITLRIKDETKFLYKKKQKLNTDLYIKHLQIADEWGNTWQLIAYNTQESLQMEASKKYNSINKKLNHLTKTQTDQHTSPHQFYPSLINHTKIVFTPEETALLNKGPKYNLGFKQKTGLKP
jgi:hypothetical protein